MAGLLGFLGIVREGALVYLSVMLLASVYLFVFTDRRRADAAARDTIQSRRDEAA